MGAVGADVAAVSLNTNCPTVSEAAAPYLRFFGRPWAWRHFQLVRHRQRAHDGGSHFAPPSIAPAPPLRAYARAVRRAIAAELAPLPRL